MAQNMKAILNEYTESKAMTNVLFGDTIKVQGGSSLALTSFNASFIINDQLRSLPVQSFQLNIKNKRIL